MKLQKPQFSFLTAVEADVLFPAGLCAVLPALWQLPRPGSSDPSKLLAPKSVPVGVRAAQQGCAEMGSAGFGTGSLQGSGTRAKIPISYLAPPSHPCHSAHFLKEPLWSLQTTELFSSSPPCSSIPSGVCFPVLPRLLHLNTVIVLRWAF